MSFAARTKDNPGDVGRAADQQQSVDNENALYAGQLGPGPVATGGMVRQFVKKTGIADNVATEFATVTTANEAGNTDGGGYTIFGVLTVFHAGVSNGDNAVEQVHIYVGRAQQAAGTGTVGYASTTITQTLAESEGGTTRGISSITITAVETSEYVISLRAQIDLDGNAVTTARIMGMLELVYAGYLTPPVITSAE
jgi:hypothetical protein